MASMFLAHHHMINIPTGDSCKPTTSGSSGSASSSSSSSWLRKEPGNIPLKSGESEGESVQTKKVVCSNRPKSTISTNKKKTTASTNGCHSKGVFVDLTMDILKYRLGDDKAATQKQNKITNNKASIDPKSHEPIELTPDEAITGPRVLEQVFWQYHHNGSPLTSEILLRVRPSEKDGENTGDGGEEEKEKNGKKKEVRVGEMELFDQQPYRHCDKIILTRTGSLANMPNKCLAVAFVDEGYISMRHPPRYDKNKNIESNSESVSMSVATIDGEQKGENKDELLQFIPYYHRLGKVSGNTDQYAKDFIDHYALVTEDTLLPGVVRHVEELKKEFIEAVGYPPLTKLPDGTEKRYVTIYVE